MIAGGASLAPRRWSCPALATVARSRPWCPVVVLARAIDACEGLLVQQGHQAVVARHPLQRLHDQVLVVRAHAGLLEDGRHLVLGRRHLVVARLDRHAQAGQLALHLHHAGQHALGDRPEVVVVQLVSLGRLGPVQRAPGVDEVGALVVVLLVDQEVLLLGADRGEHALGVVVAEQVQRLEGRGAEGLHRAQERDLVVQRLAGPRHECRGDAQGGAVGVLQDERRAGRVPRGVATGLEGGADAPGGERRRIRLGLDQLLARELGDAHAVAGGPEERVVLLGRRPGERLEPVRVVGGALRQRPVLHGRRHSVRDGGIQLLPALDGGLQLAVHALGQARALRGGAEHVLRVDVVLRESEIDHFDGRSIGHPLCCAEVLVSRRHVRFRPPDVCRARRMGGPFGLRERGARRVLCSGVVRIRPTPPRGCLTGANNRSAPIIHVDNSARRHLPGGRGCIMLRW